MTQSAMAVVCGAVMALGGYWLWRKSTLIEPESYWYKLFEANYQTSPFTGHKEFAQVAEKYIKHWAKASWVLSAILMALGVCLAVF